MNCAPIQTGNRIASPTAHRCAENALSAHRTKPDAKIPALGLHIGNGHKTTMYNAATRGNARRAIIFSSVQAFSSKQEAQKPQQH